MDFVGGGSHWRPPPPPASSLLGADPRALACTPLLQQTSSFDDSHFWTAHFGKEKDVLKEGGKLELKDRWRGWKDAVEAEGGL